jgi:hypothetical protein
MDDTGTLSVDEPGPASANGTKLAPHVKWIEPSVTAAVTWTATPGTACEMGRAKATIPVSPAWVVCTLRVRW